MSERTEPASELSVLSFGEGPRLAVAVHGITASAMSWPAVARNLPAQWRLLAPDLRGRGASAGLPGPYGLGRHAEDVCALVRAHGGSAVLVGHSMGAWVALLAAESQPELFSRLILVDGGLPSPAPPPDVPIDELLAATLGPALARLSQTYATEQAYVDFFRAHPAFAQTWNDDIEAYVRYDLTGHAGELRSRVVEDAVRQDGRDVLDQAGAFDRAWDTLSVPTLLMLAPKGMFGQAPGILPEQVVAHALQRRPDVAMETLTEANHYTIAFDQQYAATIARRIDDRSTWPPAGAR